jgi:rubredoxin
LFSLDFLKEICSLCLKTRVGQLYTTPWKSLIIKAVNEADRKEWGVILNKYRLNVRHASNELNWQLENLCDESLLLKQQLVTEFEAHELRTYGLCFAIKTQPKTGLLGSVTIKKTGTGLFDILHTKNFNPNSKEFVSYKVSVKRGNLCKHLMALCDSFYELLIDNAVLKDPEIAIANSVEVKEAFDMIYQCKNCFTIYDSASITPDGGQATLSAFEKLESYLCTVCDAPKEDFILIKKRISVH